MSIDFKKLDEEAGVSKMETVQSVVDPQDLNIQETQAKLTEIEKTENFFKQLDEEAGVGQETDFAALDKEAGIGIEGEVIHAEDIEPEELYRNALREARAKLTPDERFVTDRGFTSEASYLMEEQPDVKYAKSWTPFKSGVRTIDEAKSKQIVFETNVKALPKNHPVKIAHDNWQRQQDQIKKILVMKGLIKPEKQYQGVFSSFTDAFKSMTTQVGSALAGTVGSVTPEEGTLFWSKGGIEELADNLYEKSQDQLPSPDGGWMGMVAQTVGQALPYMLASTGAAVLTGSPWAAFGVGFAVEGDSEYRSIKAAGGTEYEAQMGRMITGTVNGAIESLQVSHIIKFAKPGAKSTKGLIKLIKQKAWKQALKAGKDLTYTQLQIMVREGIEEALQEMVSIGNLTIAVPESFDAKQAVKQVGLASLGGAIAGGILGAGGKIITGGKTKSEFDEMRPTREASDVPTMVETAEGTIGFEAEDFAEPIVDEFAQRLTPRQKIKEVVLKATMPIARKFNPKTVDAIVEATNNSGGSTINIETGKAVTKGFAVAIDTGTDKTFEKIIDSEKITKKDVQEYAKEHKADLEADKNRTIGTWVDNGKTYLDISTVVETEDEAQAIAQKTDQESIFNLENFETIETKPEVLAPTMRPGYGQAAELLHNIASSTEKGINKKNKHTVVKALVDELGNTYKKDVIGADPGFWTRQEEHFKKQVAKFHYWMARTYQTLRTLDGGKDGLLTNLIYKGVKDKVVEAHIKNANTIIGLRSFLTETGMDISELFKPAKTLTINGKNYKLSPSQKIEIYLSTLNDNNLRHLKQNGMSEEIINEIATSLTDKEMEIANFLLDEYGGVWDGIADIYKKQSGKQLGKPENFSPIVTDRDFINFKTDYEESLFDRKLIPKRGLASGELKKRLNAKSPLKLDGAVENYLGYMFHTNMYSSLALVADDVGNVLNDRNFQQSLKDATNHDVARDLRKWLEDTLSNTTRAETDLADKLVNGLRRDAVTYLLGFNVVTMARQPISTCLAAAQNPRMLPFMIHNFQHLITDYADMKKEVYSKSPLVETRSMERELKENAAKRSPKHTLKGTKGLRDVSFAPLQFMDRSTVIVVWKSAYELSQSQGNNEFDSRTYADNVITRTQPMAGFEDLPPAFRGGAVSRLFTAFQNQVNQNYNYWAHDIYKAKKAGRISNAMFTYRILMGHILPAFLLGTMSRGRLPDPKELLADEFGYFAGMYYFFGQWINSMIRGYSASNISAFAGMDNINRMANTKDPVKRITFGLKGAGAVLGIPLNQPIRTMEGCVDLWDGKTDDVMRVIYSEAQRQGMKEKETATSLARIKGGTTRISKRR